MMRLKAALAALPASRAKQHAWFPLFEGTPHTGGVSGALCAYDFLQEHESPQLQSAPHAQPGAWLFAGVLWQPQLQVAPGHDPQLHGFELLNIWKLL
jgi:hypothetical protein